MKFETHKIVLVVQDLVVKGGHKVAIVSGDIHYHRTKEDKEKYEELKEQIMNEKDEDRKNILQNELLMLKHVASFQMSLDSNREFKRLISALSQEAIGLREKELQR